MNNSNINHTLGHPKPTRLSSLPNEMIKEVRNHLDLDDYRKFVIAISYSNEFANVEIPYLNAQVNQLTRLQDLLKTHIVWPYLEFRSVQVKSLDEEKRNEIRQIITRNAPYFKNFKCDIYTHRIIKWYYSFYRSYV